MFAAWGSQQRYCDGVGRREFLRVGGLGLAGLGLADVLKADAVQASTARPKSVIYVVLPGGPSHIDMWDLKPHAPLEYRGPFQPIATKLPGVQISEYMPLQAEIMDQIAVVRGIRSVENDHYLSEVFSGHPRTAGKRPAFGSVVSRLAPSNSAIPTYVSLKEASVDLFEYEQAHYAGAGHAPFRPFENALADMQPTLALDRISNRKQLLTSFDNLQRRLDQTDAYAGLDRFQTKALEIMASPAVRDAFDISKESPETVARYGRGRYPHQTVKSIMYDWESKAFLRARRLVEAGARVVTVHAAAWDHHTAAEGDIFFALRNLMPALDRSIYALVTDLKERGLENDVLVCVLGEFGRTPKIGYPGPGRDHWAEAGCAVFFGGGLKMGQVVGATDSRAERSIDGDIGFQNVIATIYHTLGINPRLTLPDFNGRPQYLLDDARPISALVG